MADYMLATQRSATQDRAVHRTSPLTALKALRWLSRIAEWQDLGTALNAPVVSSYAHATISKDRRESYPIPLAVIVGFERAVCDPATSDTIALLLGAILLCTHASLRFGDAQRIAWHSLQLSPTALHGTCYRTKTSVSGQPFAVRWHGIAGRDLKTSWVLHWLGRLARQYTAPRTGPLAEARPDFIFINCNPQMPLPLELAPASYARTLLHRRWATQSTAILGSYALHSSEACELTLHSMKTTMLASAAQLDLSREDRMAQGHHRDSATLYSRNDTFASLRVQRELCTRIASGFRPERSMARGAQAPLPEPPFSLPAQPPEEKLSTAELQAGPWALFTSRHETFQDAHACSVAAAPEAQQDATDQQNLISASSDSEAEAVRAWAQQNSPSDHENDGDTESHHPKALWVCNGPWSAMHRTTAASAAAYQSAGSTDATLLQARCGCKLGIAALAVWASWPANACRRNGCC